MHFSVWGYAMFRVTLMGLLGTSLVLSAHSASAVDRSWIDTGGGLNNWNDATNWNPNDDFAQAGDNALFNQDATYTVIVQAPSVAAAITFTNGNVTLGGGTLNTGGVATIDDPFAVSFGVGAIVTLSGATWNSAGDATIGDVGFGTLTIDSGGDFEADEIFVGNQVGGTGEITVTGTGSMLTAVRGANTGIVIIGNNGGTGTINVLDDADLRTTSTGGNDIWVGSGVDPGDANNVSTGTLNVDGIGSFAETEDLNVGILGGTGFLNITNGGQVILTDGNSSDTTFGANDAVGGSKSSGSGVVDGDGSLLQSRDIFVGGSGSGTLQVSNGGVAQTLVEVTSFGAMLIGNNAGSDGQVAVFGAGTSASLLDVDQSLFVGDAGLGVLRIGQELDGTANGTGALQVDVDMRIGDNTSNTENNRVVVDGANATANVDNVSYVGLSGTGTLEVTGGAQFTGRFLRVGHNTTSTGTLLIDGAGSLLDTDADTTDVTDDTVIGTGGIGIATVSNGGRLNTDALWVGYQGNSVGTLTIDGGTVNAGVDNQGSGGSDLIIGGRTDAGSGGDGTVTVENGGVLTSAVLTIIGGNGASKGTLTITGAGSLLDNSDNGPNSAPNDTLRVGQSRAGQVTGGEAYLNILDGGRLHTEAAWTGLGTGTNAAEVLVDGAGSTFETDNFLRIGDGRASTFTVSNGGTLKVATSAEASANNNRLVIGYLASGDGAKLTVTGTGSLVDFFGNDRISVGLSGGESNNRSTLEVLDGAHLNAVQRDVSNAVVSSGFLMVGDSTGSHGQVTVDGAGSRVDVRYLHVGDGPSNSSGIVDITNGGVITTLDRVEVGSFGSAVGTLNVDGVGSTLTVGGYLSLGDDTLGGATNGATGNLNITKGGTVSNAGQAYVGHFTSSFGTATVGSDTANTSSWTIGGELTIAGTETSSQLSGFGVLNVNTGGLVDVASNLRIRNLGDVNLDGGEIRVGGDIFFTDAGSTLNFNTGTLRFTGSKTLDAPALDGIFAGAPVPTLRANQHLAVDGAATLDAPLRLNDPTATLSIGTINDLAKLDWDAGTLNVTNQNVLIGVGGLLGQSVIINQNQSLGVHSNNLRVQANADLHVVRGGLHTVIATNDNNGLIVISNTSNVDFDTNNNDSGLTNNGDLVAINSTIAGAIVNNGSIEIVGTVNFTDGVTLSALGSLGIDIDGLLDFDAISVGGDLSLDGLLNVDVSDFLLSSGGDTFEIIDVDGALSGTFAGLADGALVGNFGGVDFFIDYDGGDGNDVVLFTGIGVDVDLDNDGDVDGADFLAIQRTNPALIPDWELQYGSPGALGSQAVPEPSTVWLALVALASYASVRRS